MRIKTFHLPQLHNGESMTFHEESYEQLSHADPAQFGISDPVAIYRDAIAEQRLSIDVFTSSEKSDKSIKLDNQRDRKYSAFKAYLKVYVNDEDSVMSEAAERILFVVRKSALDNGDPTRLGLAKETTAINSLLRNLEPLHADIELIGAAERLNELSTANRLFEELQIERNIEKAGKHSGNVKAARAVTDAAYNTIVELINAQVLLHGGNMFDSYIKEQNTIIDKYANLVAQRKGIVKKNKETEKKK
jgi:predicted Zn-dependent protease